MDQSLGATLKQARERKGVSLRQIAAATKISVPALESIERNDFSRLPGGIFSRAFVRSYAIEVGLDPDETVREFLRIVEGEGEIDGGEISTRSSHARPHAAGRRDAARDSTPEFEFQSRQRVASVALRLVAISVPVAAVILYLGSRPWAPPQEPHPARITPQLEEPEPAAETAAVSTPAPALSAPPAPAPVADVQPASLAAPVPPEGDGVSVEIAPTADCWAQLTVDGSVALSRVIKSGEREKRVFHDSAVLHVGDAAACAILIDGRPTRPLGPPRKVRQLRITRDSYPALLR